jgi:type IV pilus assembly protein PilM
MKLPSILTTPAPAIALEIGSRQVSALAVTRHGTATVISAHAVETIPAGAVTPSLVGQNVSDRAALGRAVAQALGRLGTRPRRIALVLPDAIAKVSLVRLDAVPPGARDLDQLIRWHVRKSAPFPIEDAQVTYSPGAGWPDGAREFIVALARRDVVREYESVCEEAGAYAGMVDLSAFSLVNAVLASVRAVQGDWLLVHVTAGSGTIVILRDGDLIFYRNRAEGGDDSLPDLVHQTAMYYEDRLEGRGFARVLITASGDGTPAEGFDEMRRQVDARLGVKTETVDPRRIAQFADRITVDPALLNMMTPLVGALAGAGAGV